MNMDFIAIHVKNRTKIYHFPFLSHDKGDIMALSLDPYSPRPPVFRFPADFPPAAHKPEHQGAPRVHHNHQGGSKC